MPPRLAILLGAFALLAGCATKDSVPPPLLADATVEVVTARAAGGGQGPRGIADRFTTEGAMVAFVIVKWPEGRKPSGHQVFESRWYSGDKLVVQREIAFDINRSPFDFYSNVLPINLGPGMARYELRADGRLIASKSFEIVVAGRPAVPVRAPVRDSST